MSDYDTRHGTKPLPIIPNDSQVWVTTGNHRSPGHVTAQAEAPRSYLVETPSGQVRRNRANLTVIPNSSVSEHTSSYHRDIHIIYITEILSHNIYHICDQAGSFSDRDSAMHLVLLKLMISQIGTGLLGDGTAFAQPSTRIQK